MRSIRRNRKGVETILAALLLVVITVVMSVIIYTWSTGVFGAILPAPPNGKETLTLENQMYTGGNNVTLYIRNTGTALTTLVSYYVQDYSGNQYALPVWSGGTVGPGQLIRATILTGPICRSCNLSGSSFTFQQGNDYSIQIVSKQNNQFSFTISR